MTSPPRRAPFPALRHRRKRRNAWMREMTAEHRLHPSDLILPVFVHEGSQPEPIPSLPGVSRLSLDGLAKLAVEASNLGIPALAIFPVVPGEKKSEQAEEAWNRKNLACRAVEAVHAVEADLGTICDVALDPYTSHGQDGILRNGEILNDETIEALCKQAVCQADAGCDIIAPSDMMDGRVGAIRRALDLAGHEHVSILSYAATYASAFYGPFRDAVGSKQSLAGADKRTYQMDPRNGAEALQEVASDLDEGADFVMVKPGLPYLDVVRKVKDTFGVPTFAYHVSGEYAMLHAAAQNGWLDLEACMHEALIAFKRSGADAILTYAALDVARSLHAR
ncbi:MAG: porphobilinogen synthase [Planctomycetota bacterium]